jgi:uncharacterized protein (DUF58 family)
MTLLLGFAAVNTGNNLLYLLVSALLGFMAVSGILGRWNLARLSLRCLPPEEVFDGVPTLLGIELVNGRRFLPVCLLEIAVGDERGLFPLVEPGTSRRRSLAVTLTGRGWQRLPTVTVRSRFPINFFIRSLTLAVADPVLVFPRPQPCALAWQADPGGVRGEEAARHKGQEGEVSRIGDYRGGEPLRLIHWKLSARHDQLKVKELSATSRAPVILDLNAVPGTGLEERLRSATYLIQQQLRAGRPVGLRVGATLFPARLGHPHKLHLLRALALYDRHQDAA